jgi:hypothetical protein
MILHPESSEPPQEKDLPLMGKRMMAAGLITKAQLNQLVIKQSSLKNKGIDIRLGELAVLEGYTTTEAVESLPGYIGDKLVDAGLITPEQQLSLIGKQKEMRAAGKRIRFGELAVQERYTSLEEIELLFMMRGLNIF